MKKHQYLIIITCFFLLPSKVNAVGPFNLPFYEPHSINAYVDLDLRTDWVYDYAHGTPWQESVTGWTLGKAYDGHQGTDYNLSSGTQVTAAADGEVLDTLDDQVNTYDPFTDTCSSPETGNKINIQHDDSYETRYYHLLSDNLQVGDTDPVTSGQYIAKSGNTGCSTGAHLHFEVRESGDVVDPYSNDLWFTNPPSVASSYLNQTLEGVEYDLSQPAQTISSNIEKNIESITVKMRWTAGANSTCINNASPWRIEVHKISPNVYIAGSDIPKTSIGATFSEVTSYFSTNVTLKDIDGFRIRQPSSGSGWACLNPPDWNIGTIRVSANNSNPYSGGQFGTYSGVDLYFKIEYKNQ